MSENGVQLPTPPSDNESPFNVQLRPVAKASRFVNASGTWDGQKHAGWDTTSSKSLSSSSSSPPPLDDAEPPSFEASMADEVLQSSLDPLQISAQQFDFPDPSSSHDSPSSMQAELDRDTDLDGIELSPANWDPHSHSLKTIQLDEVSPPPTDDVNDYSSLAHHSEDDLSDV